MVEHLASDSVAAHAEIVKKDFVESLELAQSYGQIESAAEDRKEKILETVEAWFVRCRESGDYGFFAAIVEAFKKSMRSIAARLFPKSWTSCRRICCPPLTKRRASAARRRS